LELLSSTPAGQVKIPTGMNFWAGLKKTKKKGRGPPCRWFKKNLKHNFQFTTKKRERERERAYDRTVS